MIPRFLGSVATIGRDNYTLAREVRSNFNTVAPPESSDDVGRMTDRWDTATTTVRDGRKSERGREEGVRRGGGGGGIHLLARESRSARAILRRLDISR